MAGADSEDAGPTTDAALPAREPALQVIVLVSRDVFAPVYRTWSSAAGRSLAGRPCLCPSRQPLCHKSHLGEPRRCRGPQAPDICIFLCFLCSSVQDLGPLFSSSLRSRYSGGSIVCDGCSIGRRGAGRADAHPSGQEPMAIHSLLRDAMSCLHASETALAIGSNIPYKYCRRIAMESACVGRAGCTRASRPCSEPRADSGRRSRATWPMATQMAFFTIFLYKRVGV